MKIGVIAPSQVPSTAANSIQVMKVCQALVQTGNEVQLWVPGEKPVDWSELTVFYGLITSFEIVWLPARSAWRRYDFAWKALKQVHQWGADCVYTWMPQTAVLAMWRGLPALLEVHMMPSGRLGPWLFRRFVTSKVEKRLLPITDALRVRLEETFDMDLRGDDVVVAPMGSEPERYRDLPDAPDARHRLGLPQGITAGYTGHFYPGRGMQLLLDLAQSCPQINFLWIGGREKDVVFWRKKLEASGVKNVILTGFVENEHLPLYQAAADILLMPYEHSVGVSGQGDTADVCSPMKMFDYLAAGRVIVSSDLPVLHEVLNIGNAVLCPPDDLDAWRAALEQLAANEPERQRLSQQAKEDALQYSWRERAEKTLKRFLKTD